MVPHFAAGLAILIICSGLALTLQLALPRWKAQGDVPPCLMALRSAFSLLTMNQQS